MAFKIKYTIKEGEAERLQMEALIKAMEEATQTFTWTSVNSKNTYTPSPQLWGQYNMSIDPYHLSNSTPTSTAKFMTIDMSTNTIIN